MFRQFCSAIIRYKRVQYLIGKVYYGRGLAFTINVIKYTNQLTYYSQCSGFGGLEVSVVAFGTRVRGLKPGRSRRIFSGEKILSAPSFGGEVKPSVSCRKFTACKRTQKWRGSRHFRQNSRKFLAHSSAFLCWGSLASFQTLGEHLVLRVGTF